jgi:hypothetical protein
MQCPLVKCIQQGLAIFFWRSLPSERGGHAPSPSHLAIIPPKQPHEGTYGSNPQYQPCQGLIFDLLRTNSSRAATSGYQRSTAFQRTNDVTIFGFNLLPTITIIFIILLFNYNGRDSFLRLAKNEMTAGQWILDTNSTGSTICKPFESFCG